MVAQIAPAVRVAIAETVGLAPCDVKVGQLVTALTMLGFDYVFGECRCHRWCTRCQQCGRQHSTCSARVAVLTVSAHVFILMGHWAQGQ